MTAAAFIGLIAGSAMKLAAPFGPWLLIPADASIDAGGLLALAANTACLIIQAVEKGLDTEPREILPARFEQTCCLRID